MKRLCTLALTGLFTAGLAGLIGCHADAGVGDDTSTSSTSSDTGTSYSKKTTTVQEPNGDTSTRTEVRKNNGY